ncbi:MAG: hypothetical protein N2446_03520 [Elusimicrobiales bacterium]|nr:hypothetical protein [Elusimicrobiales bacterium]
MTNFNNKIEEIIRRGLIKASDRLKRVTLLDWNISEINIGPIKVDDEECICVYLRSEPKNEFSGVVAITEKDAEKVVKYFLQSYFPKFNTLEILEFFVNELGNIILNSCLSEFANELSEVIIPNSPHTIKGSKLFIIENILSMMGDSFEQAVVSSRIKIVVKNTIILDVFYFISRNFIKKII